MNKQSRYNYLHTYTHAHTIFCRRRRWSVSTLRDISYRRENGSVPGNAETRQLNWPAFCLGKTYIINVLR